MKIFSYVLRIFFDIKIFKLNVFCKHYSLFIFSIIDFSKELFVFFDDDVLVFDEIKIYNFALNDSQVRELYLGQFRSVELESSVVNFDSGTGNLDFDVTFFFIEKSADLSCNFYYSSK